MLFFYHRFFRRATATLICCRLSMLSAALCFRFDTLSVSYAIFAMLRCFFDLSPPLILRRRHTRVSSLYAADVYAAA